MTERQANGAEREGEALLRQLGARVRDEEQEPELPVGVAPFDDAMAERIAARLLARSTAAPGPTTAPTAPATRLDATRARRRIWAAAAPLAAAAALLLWVVARAPAGDDAGMPAYELTATSAKLQRADPGSAPEHGELLVDPEGELELLLRPSVAAPGVRARAVLVADGNAQAWQAPLAISEEGAVRVAGPTKALFPETRGTYEVVIVLARGDALPSVPDAVKIATGESAPPPAGVRTVRARVRFLDVR